jgi:putative FmdB family regulatory protein
MPAYEYRCPVCASADLRVRTIEHRDDRVVCRCGAAMTREISTIAVVESAPLPHRESLQGRAVRKVRDAKL